MTDLRKLSEAATPGEWEHADHFADVRFDREIWPVGGLEEGLAYANASDAAFIAALVNDFRSGSLIPLSEYERVLALLAEARAAFDGCIEVMDEEADHRLEGWQETDAYVVAVTAPLASAREVRARIDDALAAGPEAKG